MPPPPPVNPERLSPAESRERTLHFFHGLGVDVPLPASAERADAYSALVRAIISSATVSSSRVSCTLTISPGVANQYNTLHGGAVAAVAEAVGMACARTATGDKEMFLGELSTAYLAAARVNVSFLEKLSCTLICRFSFPNCFFHRHPALAVQHDRVDLH